MVKGIEQTVSGGSARTAICITVFLRPVSAAAQITPTSPTMILSTFETQYTARFHHPNSAIRMLAQTKLNWMQKNHVVILY